MPMTTESVLNAPAPELTITDPRDGSVVGTVEMTNIDALPSIVNDAKTGFATWSMTDAAERGRALRRAGDALFANAEALATMNARETGRPFDEAVAGITAGAETLVQYAELGPLHGGSRLAGSPLAIDYSIAEPRGVVAVLTPWNDPVAVAAGLIGAALVTGNTVVHKPSERCPHLGEILGEILAGALPDGVLTTVTGDGAVGAALIEQPIDVVAHVGSTKTGEYIARVASLTGAHVVRENGGNDALIVDRDVDPVWAANQAATGAYANVGQICTSVERIFVHSDIAEAFTAALVTESERWAVSLAPLVDQRLRDSVHAQVSGSLALGARALTGGVVPEGAGAYYPPTVLVDCSPNMPVMAEETFGPVAPVCVVPDFARGLELAASDRYGLAATVLTASLENAATAARSLPVGTVKINAVFGGAPGGSAQPRGASGAGFGYGPNLLDEMTTLKVVHVGTPGRAS
jgi:betaine-aldehyde dehydrogenase